MSYGRQLLQLQPVAGCSVSLQSSSVTCSTCTVTCVTGKGATVGPITVSGCNRDGNCKPCEDSKSLDQDCVNKYPSQCPIVNNVPQCHGGPTTCPQS